MHVTKLQKEMVDVKLRISHLKSSFGARPFAPKATEVDPVSGFADVGRGSAAHAPAPPVDGSQPIKLGPVGPLANHFLALGLTEYTKVTHTWG